MKKAENWTGIFYTIPGMHVRERAGDGSPRRYGTAEGGRRGICTKGKVWTRRREGEECWERERQNAAEVEGEDTNTTQW